MNPWEIEVFYDGACPLCVREMRFMMRMDRSKGRIRFTDIADERFDESAVGVSYATLMDKIHGRLPTGEIIVGVEVFRKLYEAIGWRRIAAASRLPGLSHALDLGYRIFAKYRLRMTGRCKDGSCAAVRMPERA